MTYDIGPTGLQILLGFSFGFGAIVQVVAGARSTRWLWLVGAIGWFIGAVFASEILVGTMTVDQIQPIIDGLAFDEALLGGLLGGLALSLAGWYVSRQPVARRPSIA
jgi:hypothetical protein